MSEKDKSEALALLNQQLETERRLVEIYEETSPLILSESARWLLHMLQMDSRKHIAILTLAADILQGRRIGYPTRQETTIGLEKHMALEAESIERARKLRANPLIKENPGLSRLLATWADDEKHHHTTLQRLRDERYTRMAPLDAYTQYRRTALEQLAEEIKKLASRQ